MIVWPPIPGKQETSRRRKYRSTKKKNTIDLRLKSSYIITSKAGLIQRILILRTRKNILLTKLHWARPMNIKIRRMDGNYGMGQPRMYTIPRQCCFKA